MYMLWMGAVLAGLFLGSRELIPYFAALKGGVIARKGAQNVRIRRDDDPEGFARLLANRSKGAVVGLGLFVLGILGLGMSWLSITSSPWAVLIVVVVYFCFGLFAVVCLVRGFVTGRMFAFWSLALFGEATRKQNPSWFWMYAGLNVLIALFAALILLGALASS